MNLSKQHRKELNQAKKERFLRLNTKYYVPEFYRLSTTRTDKIIIYGLIFIGLFLILGLLLKPPTSIPELYMAFVKGIMGVFFILLSFIFNITDKLMELKYWLIIEPKEHPKDLMNEINKGGKA